ncbi:MAG: twin-arginine translocase subunit TatC [bacterium]
MTLIWACAKFKAVADPDKTQMTVVEHLDELRTRLIISLIAIAVCSAACWFLNLKALELLTSRVEGKLIYLGPADAFLARLKISLIMGLAVATPVIFWQAWLFVAPGLYPRERRYAGPVIIIAVLLFALGGAFGLFTVPITLNFLQKFGGGVLEATYTVDKFMSFATSIILAFAIVFETPLVLVFLAKVGVVTHKTLAASRKYAFLIILIVAAVLTPADIVSMLIMAGPLYVLFEISLFATRFVAPTRREEDSTGTQ